ncbi:unnamed protein product [Cuscuta campestris]|uniref:Rho termination factor-like N-terminal domain-containing protein n=1 Tax=Cuscuta campestris TaxID=132261 RepID=A0A484MDB2_9ASTE|nr:unnamed protein product [Cuscuta campestris]
MGFSEDLDFSIWDCKYTQDERCSENTWPFDLYFSPRLDIIEENALNEKSCIEVLNILNAKGKAEIFKCETNIEKLKSDLALVDDKWDAPCLTTSSQKINIMDGMTQDLKDANVNGDLDQGTQQMNKNIAENMLETLLQDSSPQSDEEVLNAVTKDSAAEPLRDDDCSNQRRKRIRIGSEDLCEDEVGGLSNFDGCIGLSTTKEATGTKAAGGNMGTSVDSINREAKEAVISQSIENETASQLSEMRLISKEEKGQGTLLGKTEDSVGEEFLSVWFNKKVKDLRKTKIKTEPHEDKQFEGSDSSLCVKLRNDKLMEKEWAAFEKLDCVAEELGSKPPPNRQKTGCKSRSGDKTTIISPLATKNESQTALVPAKNVGFAPPTERKIVDLPSVKEEEMSGGFQMIAATSSGTLIDVEASTGNIAEAADVPLERELERMKMKQLIAIAKEHNLRGRHSLKKTELQQRLLLFLQAKRSNHI